MRVRTAVAVMVAVGWLGQGSTARAEAPFPPPPPAHDFPFAASPALLGSQWSYISDDVWTPDTCAPTVRGICYQEGYALAANDASASGGTPTELSVEVYQYSVDASGVLHVSGASVESGAPLGIAIPFKPGPTSTQGAMGMIAGSAPNSEAGTGHVMAIFTTATLNRFREGGAVISGSESVAVSGIIYNGHWNGSGWVDDPTTTGTLAFQSGPTSNSNAWVCSSVQLVPICAP